MLNSKCSHIKFNNKTCNNISYIKIKYNNYCFNHASLLYNKPVLYIQKIYKGYKTRKYYNNIFKKLPKDIQIIIINYINKEHYKKKYLNTISRIVCNKSLDLHNYINSDKKLSVDYIYNCYYLYTKYHKIIPINYLKHLYVLSHSIISFCNIILHMTNNNMDSYLIYEKINVSNLSVDNILNLIHAVNKYANLYSLKYEIYNHIYLT